MSVYFGPLGRNTPQHYDHVEASPLTALAVVERPTFVPVTFGINWYTAFDRPMLGSDGKYYLPSKFLGYIRGGHAICAEPAPQPDQPGREQDALGWWQFYNQLAEGACEGFSHARTLSLLYRETYDAFWIYDDARRCENTYPSGEGTSNAAACEALIRWGAHQEGGEECRREPWTAKNARPPRGIKAFRWAKTAEEVWATLGLKSNETAGLLNSWGRGYPRRVEMTPELCDRLLREGGECDVITEK